MKPDPIWTLPAVGVWTLGNTGGRRETFWDQGYRRVDILIAEGIIPHTHNISELIKIGPTLIREGWTITTWHSTTGVQSPRDEAWTAIQAIKQVEQIVKISGHILNGEAWYEGIARWKTKAYWDSFIDEGQLNIPVAVWPLGSDTAEHARDFDYASCIARGCMVYPQQYQNEFPSYTISAGDANLNRAKVPVENRGTSPGVYINSAAKSVPWDAYHADLVQLRRPVLIYYGDTGPLDMSQTGKLVVEGTPEPEPEPEPEPNGGSMEPIGYQDGITAFKEWFYKLSVFIDGYNKWRALPDAQRSVVAPPIAPKIPLKGPAYDENDMTTWPWPDKFYDNTMRKLKDGYDSAEI